MITLYHAPRSRSGRILWLLEEVGQPYEIKPVSIFRPMSGEGAGDPANPHPDSRVPAIAHNGQVVAESVAIVLYLNDAFPAAGLGPTPFETTRGDYLTWVCWYAAEMEPAMFASMGGELADAPMKQRNFDAVVARIEQALASSSYLMGQRFTGVDLLVAGALDFGRKAFPESDVIDRYIMRCKARPGALMAVERDEASGVQKAA